MSRITRREFVQSAGGAAVGVTALHALAQQEPSAAPRRPRNIRKAVKLGMVAGDLTVLEKFRLLKNLGYDGVELGSPSDLDRDEVLRARDETGLVIHGVVCTKHWKHPLSHPDASERERCRHAMEAAIRDCRVYGGTTALLVAGVVNGSIDYADAYRRSQEEIRRLLPVAAEHEVTIAIENVWNHFLLSPLEAARFVDELESPWIGWYFDVGNVVNYGWPEQWVRTLGRRIVKLDVKEFSRTKRDKEGLWKGFNVKLLEGDCNWPAVMAALDEISYTGWATAELAGGDAAWLKDVADRMDRIIAS
ncbi:MAG: sugar phosphate isomerase/epimerase [Planctomycetes bacterium]|nr:sugar phosphate isomerase/epimerase [Planctomycetota bacterium]